MTETKDKSPKRNDKIEPGVSGLKQDYIADCIGPGLHRGWTVWTQNGRCITVDATKDPDVWLERT